MSVTNRVGRGDWLLAIRIALMVSIGLTMTYGLSIIVAAALREPVTLPFAVDAGQVGDLPTGTTLADDATIDVRVDPPTWTQAILHAFTRLPSVVVVVWVFLLLVRVVTDARQCDPFTQGTVRRLRAVGLILMFAGTASDAVQFLAGFALSGTLDTGSFWGNYIFTGIWLMAGVGALAVAEVINRGQVMRAELDQVI